MAWVVLKLAENYIKIVRSYLSWLLIFFNPLSVFDMILSSHATSIFCPWHNITQMYIAYL